MLRIVGFIGFLVLPILPGCITGGMWQETTKEKINDPLLLGVVHPDPHNANDTSCLLIECTIQHGPFFDNKSREHFLLPLDSAGDAVMPYGYHGAKRDWDAIEDAIIKHLSDFKDQDPLRPLSFRQARQLIASARFVPGDFTKMGHCQRYGRHIYGYYVSDAPARDCIHVEKRSADDSSLATVKRQADLDGYSWI